MAPGKRSAAQNDSLYPPLTELEFLSLLTAAGKPPMGCIPHVMSAQVLSIHWNCSNAAGHGRIMSCSVYQCRPVAGGQNWNLMKWRTSPDVQVSATMNVQKERAPSAGLAARTTATPSLSRPGQPGPSHNPGASKSASAKPVRILVVDDHPIVRKGLNECLARHKHLVVVGEAKDGVEALAKARELSPDLVLMDIDMPKLNGLAASEILHKENPQMKIVILSVHNPAQYALRIANCGAHGCVSKDAPMAELVQAIETVAGGGDFFNSEVTNATLLKFVDSQHLQQISHREREVLVAVAEGLSNKEIACRLGVSARTVETHRDHIMRKLNIHSVAGLTRFAIAQGLVPVTQRPAPQ